MRSSPDTAQPTWVMVKGWEEMQDRWDESAKQVLQVAQRAELCSRSRVPCVRSRARAESTLHMKATVPSSKSRQGRSRQHSYEFNRC